MNTPTKFLKKIKNKENTIGTWSMTSSVTAVEVLGTTGLDFVILDMEHASMSFETIENQVRAAYLRGIQPIIRLSDSFPQLILRALETGAGSIMVPHVQTKEEAEAIVLACKYPPEGKRGLSPYTRNHNFTHDNLAESLAQNNKNIFIGVLVEGTKGINNIEEIASVPGIDVIYTGIYDISQSVGHPGDLDHPKVQEAQLRCLAAVKKHNKTMGSFAKEAKDVARFMEMGIKFIAFSADGYMLKNAYKTALVPFI